MKSATEIKIKPYYREAWDRIWTCISVAPYEYTLDNLYPDLRDELSGEEIDFTREDLESIVMQGVEMGAIKWVDHNGHKFIRPLLTSVNIWGTNEPFDSFAGALGVFFFRNDGSY